MTRREFIDDVTTFGELIEFCNENDCDRCYDVVDVDGRDELIEDEIRDYIIYDSWRDLPDLLYGIPTGYEYYRHHGGFDFDGLDDSDFEELKEEVLDWCDGLDCWDPDKEEEDMSAEESAPDLADDEEEPLVCEEAFSIFDLMNMCAQYAPT